MTQAVECNNSPIQGLMGTNKEHLKLNNKAELITPSCGWLRGLRELRKLDRKAELHGTATKTLVFLGNATGLKETFVITIIFLRIPKRR